MRPVGERRFHGLYLTKQLSRSSPHQQHFSKPEETCLPLRDERCGSSAKMSLSCLAVFPSAPLCLSNVLQTLCVSLSFLSFNCLFITHVLCSFQFSVHFFSFSSQLSSFHQPFLFVSLIHSHRPLFRAFVHFSMQVCICDIQMFHSLHLQNVRNKLPRARCLPPFCLSVSI